jgi:hypothetical protein
MSTKDTKFTKFTDIYIEDYTPSSVVVRGETKLHKDDLKKLGGSYNPKLRDGSVGWIFRKSTEKDIIDYIEKGVRISNGEPPRNSFIPANPSLMEFASLLSCVNSMSTKIDKIEKAVYMLLTKDQIQILEGVEQKKLKPTKKSSKDPIPSDVESDEENNSSSCSEDEKPVKRLLKR